MIGRDREMVHLDQFLDEATTRPMFLALLGDAGIGKSTLLGALAGRARKRGFRVVRLGAGGTWPRRLLGAPVPATDEPARLTRLLHALDRLADPAPMLVLIDHAERSDPGSRRLLTLLMRHLSDERVSFVLAARGTAPPAGIGPEIICYRVPPLADESAARLVGAVSGGPRREVLRRAAGNPLALTGGRLSHEYEPMVGGLPAATRRLLRYAALADEAEPVAVLNQAAGAAAGLPDWQPAEHAGLISIVDGRLRFAHPLLRDHLATSMTPAEARRVHAALAARTGDVFRRAVHRAAATTGPDEAVAAALESAAPDDARALVSAARLSPATGDAARRYAEAVLAACLGGEPAWAIELHHRVAALTDDPELRGAAAAGAGLALAQTARPTAAFELLESAAARYPRADGVALLLVSMAATAVLLSGDAGHRRRLPALLARAAHEDADPAATAFVRTVADPRFAAEPEPVDGPRTAAETLFAGAAAWLTDDTPRAIAELSAGWRAQCRAGVPGTVIVQLPQLILALLDGGRWREAESLIGEAERLAAVSGAGLLHTVLPALRVTLQVGRTGEAVTLLRPPPGGNAFAAALHHRAAGSTALAAGDHLGAYGHFRALFDDDGDPVHPVLGPISLPQLAMTAVRTGHTPQAQAIVARCRAGAAPTRRRTMLLDHATAVLHDSEEHFLRATGDPDRGLCWPMEYADAQFAYGMWLRRQRRAARESRPHLQTALDTYLRLGARAHAEHVRRFVPGLRPGDAGPAFAALPPRKQRIARMAAAGLANAEIARQLNVSPRTIASNLYHIYPQLGIGSRHQLRDLLAGVGKAA